MRVRSPCRPVVLTAVLAALSISGLPTRSAAEEPGTTAKVKEEVKEKVEQAREKVREAAKEARDEVSAAKDEARQKLQSAREEMKSAHEEMKAKLGAAREEMREEMHEKVDQVLGPPDDRAARAREHRHAAMHAMHAHFRRGADIPPPAREALRHHARLAARLTRIRALAEAAGDTKSVERCDKLIELERIHHQARMSRFLARQAEGAAPAAAAAAATGAAHDPDEGEPDEKAAEEEEEQP